MSTGHSRIYEKPVLLPLGEVSRGYADCRSGNGGTGECYSGSTATSSCFPTGQAAANICAEGSSPGSYADWQWNTQKSV